MKRINEQKLKELEVLASNLELANRNDLHALVTSLVYVRRIEECKDMLSHETYSKLIALHDNTFNSRKIKYADVLFRLAGEGYHFPPYK